MTHPSRRRRAKKTCLSQGKTIIQEEINENLAQKESEAQDDIKRCRNIRGENLGPAITWKCGNCGKADHSIRIYQVDKEMPNFNGSH